ncbi:MAG: FHA domain-containing protein [Planctomycetota bacterium]
MSDSPAPTPPAHAATIVLQIAGRPGPAFPLDPAAENVLGRAAGALVILADRLASRRHAAIRLDAPTGAWMLTDLGSRNGTWLDGVRVQRGTLADGSVIRVGTTELVFRPTASPTTPTATTNGRRAVRRGPPAELEGAALARAGSGTEPRWPMLFYQAGRRLLAATSPRDIVGTVIELAAEFTAAGSFAWLEPAADGRPTTVCVVPPGSNLPAAIAGTAWQDATGGLAVWLAGDAPADGDLVCVPVLDGGRVRAVLAAAGGVREVDFDLLVSLASLAAAAYAGREPPRAAQFVAGDSTTTDLLDESVLGGDDAGPVDGTLALTAADVERLRDEAGLPASPAAAESLRLDDWERRLAIEALRRTGGSVPEAAALLGISRATLYRRLDAYGLTRDGSPPAPG